MFEPLQDVATTRRLLALAAGLATGIAILVITSLIADWYRRHKP